MILIRNLLRRIPRSNLIIKPRSTLLLQKSLPAFYFSSSNYNEELQLLLVSQDPQTQTSFDQIKNILDFTQKKSLPITEKDVADHVDYFTKLLTQLKMDLTQFTDEQDQQQIIESLVNALKFAYAMNYDDMSLWTLICSNINKSMDKIHLNISQIIMIVSILDSLTPVQKQIIGEKRINGVKTKASKQLINIIEGNVEGITTDELINIFSVALRNLSKADNNDVFHKFDDLFTSRIAELDIDSFSQIMNELTNHNQSCEPGEEIDLQLLLLDGEAFVENNLPFFDTSQLISVIGGYATSGAIRLYPELYERFESEIKQRLTSLSTQDIAYLIRIISNAEEGTPEFYAMVDRHIGNNLAHIESQFLFPILKSFYDSGQARPKLFIKLQQQIVNKLDELNVNEICAIMRLYIEMDVQQSTFFENIARNIERRLSDIDEQGLVNAIVAFKEVQTKRQLSIVSDLEKILLQNLNSLKIESLSQILYTFVKVTDEKKNKKLLETLTLKTQERLKYMVNKGGNLTASDIMYLLLSLTQTSTDLSYIKLVMNVLPEVVEQYRDNDLQMLLTMLQQYQQNHEGFDKAFYAVKNEVDSRKSVQRVQAS